MFYLLSTGLCSCAHTSNVGGASNQFIGGGNTLDVNEYLHSTSKPCETGKKN